jgi:hypothetical protein
MKKWIYLIPVLILSSCWPCDTVIIENGTLPDAALKFIPYQNGETYQFQHSNGLIINFESIRETREEWTYCTECCKNEYHFEVNSTILIPDYPVFDFQFEISNEDTALYICNAFIGRNGFVIPTSEVQYDFFERVDFIVIDSKCYYEVWKLKSYGSYYNEDTVYADSLFYNYDFGILKILMSNGEYYKIVH